MLGVILENGWQLTGFYYLALAAGIGCGVLLTVGLLWDRSTNLRDEMRSQLEALATTERLAQAAWSARQALWREHRQHDKAKNVDT
jgi:hypothetical protein